MSQESFLVAVQKDGLNLKDVPEALRTAELVKIASEQRKSLMQAIRRRR